MSSVSKGNKAELEARNTLEAYGWEVFRQHRKPIFMHGKLITIGADIFGCDLVAKKRGGPSLWIQVSTIENLSAKKKQVETFPLVPKFESYALWMRKSGKKEFDRYSYSGDGIEHKWDGPYPIKIEERPKC